jgi:hypothetical protein
MRSAFSLYFEFRNSRGVGGTSSLTEAIFHSALSFFITNNTGVTCVVIIDPYCVLVQSTIATSGATNRIERITILAEVTSDIGSADNAVRSLSGASAVNRSEGGLL